MRSSVSLKSVSAEGRTKQKSVQLVLGLDRHQKIVTTSGCSLFGTSEQSDLIGSSLEQVDALRHLYALLAKDFCFRALPIPIDDRWYTVDYYHVEDDEGSESGRLEFCGYGRSDEAAVVLHDFVQSIDPFSLDAGGGILLIDSAGLILMVNQEFASLLALRVSEMVGCHVNDVYPESTLSRLPKVMQSGKAEIGEAHTLNGREIIASRWPLIKNGTSFGAYGKALLREGLDISRYSPKTASAEEKLTRRGAALSSHRPSALYGVDEIVCHGQTMQELKERLVRVAERSSTVLLTGESGTGKELFAHAIHNASPRRDAPFVRVNCAAIPENLLESELFGYVEGAFSGARRGGQIGKFEQAHGGTLFLDEISEMPLPMQAKLLRVLQEREVAPLGSQAIRFVDVRFIVATNCDALSLVKDNKLRSDLYYRVNVVSLHIPPLRQRLEDIFHLTRHFIDHFNSEFNMNVQGLSSKAWTALKAYSFPGNVRELRSAIESAFNMVNGPFIRLYDLPGPIAEVQDLDVSSAEENRVVTMHTIKALGEKTLQEVMEEIERNLIVSAMDKVGGNKLVAANLLGISRPGLYKKLQKYNLQ